MYRILDFAQGEILVDGHSVKKEELFCKSVMAYIPDNPDLFDYLTGIKYLNFVADVYGVSSEKRNELISLYSKNLGITADLDSPIGTYSHGMKQKLAIIAAWIHEPKLIIMVQKLQLHQIFCLYMKMLCLKVLIGG